jgi:hypothetical protein
MSVISVILIAAYFTVAAGTEWLGLIDRPLPTVTCDGLASLELGMTEEQVRARIGPPLLQRPADGRWSGAEPRELWPPEVKWYYTPDWWLAGGVRMNVEFQDGRLTEMHIYLKTVLHQKGAPIFLVDRDDPVSAAWQNQMRGAFEDYMCRGSDRVGPRYLRLATAGVSVMLIPAGVGIGWRRRRQV